jgi:hypothetical protein
MTYNDAIEEYENECENGKTRLVYAYFGLAIYFGQCFEKTLTNMIWINRISLQTIKSINELDEIIDCVENSKKTMGGLIIEINVGYSITETLKDDLKIVLELRNYLVHKFFKEQIQKFNSDLGRKEMLKYFCDFIDKSKKVDNELNNYYSHHLTRLGITEEDIKDAVSTLREN